MSKGHFCPLRFSFVKLHFYVPKNTLAGHLMCDLWLTELKLWEISLICSHLCSCVVVFYVRGQQYIAQAPTLASILHASGRSECWQQLCLRSVVQSPQLLQLLWHIHEPLSIQQPHEPRWQRALPAGQSTELSSLVCIFPHRWCSHSLVYQSPSSPSSSHTSECVIVFDCKLKFRNSVFSKITASVGFYVHVPKPWIYFSYSKLLHL